MKTLRKLGVEVVLNARVKDYDGQHLLYTGLDGTELILSGVIIWTAGVKGNTLTGFKQESIVAGNRIAVNEYNQIGEEGGGPSIVYGNKTYKAVNEMMPVRVEIYKN